MAGQRGWLAATFLAAVLPLGGAATAGGPACNGAFSHVYGSTGPIGVAAIAAPAGKEMRQAVLLTAPPSLSRPTVAVAVDGVGQSLWRLQTQPAATFLFVDVRASSGPGAKASTLLLSQEVNNGCERIRMAAVRSSDSRLVLDVPLFTTRGSEPGLSGSLVARPVPRDAAGRTGALVEERDLPAAGGITTFDLDGRESNPGTAMQGTVRFFDGVGRLVARWTQPPKTGPGPMAVSYQLGSRSAVAVLRTVAATSDGADVSIEAMDARGASLWRRQLRVLHDPLATLATRRGPVFLTRILQTANVGGATVFSPFPAAGMITALDGRDGRVLFTRQVSQQAQVFVAGGDLIVSSPDARTVESEHDPL